MYPINNLVNNSISRLVNRPISKLIVPGLRDIGSRFKNAIQKGTVDATISHKKFGLDLVEILITGNNTFSRGIGMSSAMNSVSGFGTAISATTAGLKFMLAVDKATESITGSSPANLANINRTNSQLFAGGLFTLGSVLTATPQGRGVAFLSGTMGESSKYMLGTMVKGFHDKVVMNGDIPYERVLALKMARPGDF